MMNVPQNSQLDLAYMMYMMDDLLKAAGRMFFYNRCGIAKLETYAGTNWSDDASFAQDEQTRNLADPNNSAGYVRWVV